VLGLGYNPNWHIKESNKKAKAANRSGACEAQGRAKWHWLADAYSIAGARVIAHASMTQEQEQEKKQCQIQSCGREHDPAQWHQHQWPAETTNA
jgi:hypothetical protein